MNTSTVGENRFQPAALICFLVLAVTFGLSSSGFAESAGAKKSRQGQAQTNATSEGQSAQAFREAVQEFRAKQKRMQELKSKLLSIQQKALETNPDLKEELSSLKEYRLSVLNENLNGTQVDIERMQEIEDKFKSKSANMTKAEAKELKAEYRQMRSSKEYQQARQSMASNKEVQKRTQAFNDRMLKAMKEVNPKVESMNQEWLSIRRDLQKMRQKLLRLRNQQGMQQGSK